MLSFLPSVFTDKVTNNTYRPSDPFCSSKVYVGKKLVGKTSSHLSNNFVIFTDRVYR